MDPEGRVPRGCHGGRSRLARSQHSCTLASILNATPYRSARIYSSSSMPVRHLRVWYLLQPLPRRDRLAAAWRPDRLWRTAQAARGRAYLRRKLVRQVHELDQEFGILPRQVRPNLRMHAFTANDICHAFRLRLGFGVGLGLGLALRRALPYPVRGAAPGLQTVRSRSSSRRTRAKWSAKLARVSADSGMARTLEPYS
mgnify:CR=1 FL=1